MASVEELNNAIDVIRNHCKYQSKTGDDCISCLLSVNCNLISRVEKPLKDWENVTDVYE